MTVSRRLVVRRMRYNFAHYDVLLSADIDNTSVGAESKKGNNSTEIIQFKACRGLKHLRPPVPCIPSFLNLPNCKTLSIVAWLPLFLLLPALSFPSIRTPRTLFYRVPIASCSHLLPKITRKQLLFCLSLYNLILFSLILRHKTLNKELSLASIYFIFPA